MLRNIYILFHERVKGCLCLRQNIYILSHERARGYLKIIFIIILSLFHLHSLFHSPIIITHQYTNQYSNIYTYSNSHHLFITYYLFLTSSLHINIISLIFTTFIYISISHLSLLTSLTSNNLFHIFINT